MALAINIDPSSNVFRVPIERAYCRVARFEGDKHVITLTVRAWLSEDSARMDGEPIYESQFQCEMPEKLEGNPIAWAYEQIKRSGWLGETVDC